MTPRVGQWTRNLMRQLRRGGDRSSLPQMDSDPDLPYLPDSSSSRVSLVDASANPATGTANATADSLFFARLPPEIRHQILVAAFGGRTLHMDIRESPPMLPAAERPPVTISEKDMPHGGLGADLDRYGRWPREVLKAAVEARVITPGGSGAAPWQWWSCVCHRSWPRAVPSPLWEDECVHGKSTFCSFYPGEAPGKCHIGCTGWLTTCRQAYAEGIHVLYSTNTIFLGRAKLIDALLRSTDLSVGYTSIPPAVVPTAHLARITRLEIDWDWPLATRTDHSDDEQAAARAGMAASLMRLARADAFPRLTSLVLSYGDTLYHRPEPPQTCLEDLDEALLQPLRRMTATFWKGRQNKRKRRNDRDKDSRGQDATPTLSLTVELPTNTFEPLCERAVRCGGVYDRGSGYFDRRFWCPSIVKVDEAGMPVEDEHGKDDDNKEKEENEENEENAENKGKGRRRIVDCGFWVKQGIESELNFDYQGNPYRLTAIARCS